MVKMWSSHLWSKCGAGTSEYGTRSKYIFIRQSDTALRTHRPFPTRNYYCYARGLHRQDHISSRRPIIGNWYGKKRKVCKMSVRSEVWRRKMMRSQLKEVESPRIIMFEVCAAKWALFRP